MQQKVKENIQQNYMYAHVTNTEWKESTCTNYMYIVVWSYNACF